MSSCLSLGARAYGFDLEIVKSPSTSSTITSHSSSPSSSLSESGDSPLAISTRKPRTPRKRPNQTYNEAAALLSTACPKIFSTKHLTKPRKFTKAHDFFLSNSNSDSSDLFLPFRVVVDNPGLLLQPPIPENPRFRIKPPRVLSSCEKTCRSPEEGDYPVNSVHLVDGFQDDFDAESMLDGEIEEGIDSLLGNSSVNNDSFDESYAVAVCNARDNVSSFCYGFPMGWGLGVKSLSHDWGFGLRKGVPALRQSEEGDWWRFPTVDVMDISPKSNKIPVEKKKKKKKKKEAANSDRAPPTAAESVAEPQNENPSSTPKSGPCLLLKLNHDHVLSAWSDRGSPFSDGAPSNEAAGNDLHARLAQIDLFSEYDGGLREASVLRYKEKRRTRLFSKKVRYQVRKVNADRRPRMKGRFVRWPDSPLNEPA